MKYENGKSIIENLLDEYESAINAVLGDKAKDTEYELTAEDLDAINNKVKFYTDND